MKRPIVTITIGYLIGIIYGLYFQKNIVLFCLVTILIYFSAVYLLRKYAFIKYIKYFLNIKVVFCIIIMAICSNFYVLYKNQQYDDIINNLPKEKNIIGIIVSDMQEKEYTYLYTIKDIYTNKKFILYLNKNKNNLLEYGDLINVPTNVIEIQGQKNYKGFDYKKYLKIENIYGVLKANGSVNLLEKEKENFLFSIANDIRNSITQTINAKLSKDTKDLLVGILLGDKKNISDELIDNFQKTNVLHILSVSGMHVTYIVLFITYMLDKVNIAKRKISIILIIVLLSFMFITGFSASIVRASLMGIIAIGANIFYRKVDISTSIALSLLIILSYNPFLINDIGLQLSYGGTMGIILLNKMIKKKLKSDLISVSISAQIIILPICAYNFNEISTIFLITAFLIGLIPGAIIILGWFMVFSAYIIPALSNLIAILLELLLKYFIYITKYLAQVPYSSILIKKPYIINIILYYVVFVLLYYLYFLYNKAKNRLKGYEKRILKINLKKILLYILVMVIIINVSIVISTQKSDELIIYFIDVGQR